MINDVQVPEAVARRREPLFFITDREGRVLLASPAFEKRLLHQALDTLSSALQEESERADMWFERIDSQTVLRLLPVQQGDRRLFAAFVEHDKRDGLGKAVKRYGLTRRECEVLEALVAGLSNPAIAKRLFITEATVGEHVKNLLKKTRSNKRSEMIARIFGDGAVAKPPGGAVRG